MASSALVRNPNKEPVVFTDKAIPFEVKWEGKGHPSGADVRNVPQKVIEESVNFSDLLRKGTLVIENANEEIQEVLARQMTGLTAPTPSEDPTEDDKARAAIDDTPQRNIIAVSCVGPGEREGTVCGEPVTMREKEIGEKPPLCSQHQGLAMEFVSELLEPDPQGDPSKKNVRWTRPTMTAPLTDKT